RVHRAAHIQRGRGQCHHVVAPAPPGRLSSTRAVISSKDLCLGCSCDILLG
ncbi:hypothetical protein O3G_MSEX008034, partial [Manduca sexta]